MKEDIDWKEINKIIEDERPKEEKLEAEKGELKRRIGPIIIDMESYISCNIDTDYGNIFTVINEAKKE